MILRSKVRNILVIKLRNIGDVVLTVPMFRVLKEEFPHANVTALVNSGTEEVIRGLQYIDEIIVFNRKIKDFSLIYRIAEEFIFIRKIRKKAFDLTIDLTSGDRSCIISFFSGSKIRLGYDPKGNGFFGKKFLYSHLIERDESTHMILQNLNILKVLGINSKSKNLDFFIPEEDRKFVERLLFHENNIQREYDRIVHIHPVARWLFKCWIDEYMAEVISWLIEKDIKVIITSSSENKEIEKTKKILSLIYCRNSLKRKNLLDLSGIITIKQLGAISASSHLFLGVDSAPMHIATAVGTPVIALFGPTDEKQWGPLGDNNSIIKASLDCMPCKKGNCDGIIPRKCMEAIKPYVVKKIIEAKLNEKK